MTKTRFEKANSRKLAAIALPIFILIFVLLNMAILYVILGFINVGVSDELIDNLPTVFQIEFWATGIIFSYGMFFYFLCIYGILIGWHTLDTNLFQQAITDHNDLHRLLEEEKENGK